MRMTDSPRKTFGVKPKKIIADEKNREALDEINEYKSATRVF
jgi:hypothetical protein